MAEDTVVFTNDQFERLLGRLSRNQDEHDRLVRIETIVQLSAASFDSYKTDQAVKVAELALNTKDAHKRLDEEIKTRWLFAGGVALLGIVGICTEVYRLLHG